MKLEEYQAKELLQRFDLPVPANGGAIEQENQLSAALQKAGEAPWVVKAQVQTGGRGKAGGIKVAQNAQEAADAAKKILGMKLVTAQTGPDGLTVHRVFIERASSVVKELYVSILIDRKKNGPVLIAAAEGGMDIEELAEKSPEKILKIPVALTGLEKFQCREILFHLGLFTVDNKVNAERAQFFVNLAKAFLQSDCSLLEINPLAITKEDKLICLDAKMILDDNALFRHPEVKNFDDASLKNEAERKAKETGISYIPLEGNIGCMVNGAGLAMATMDIIKQNGGDPANFLDVGGGATVEQVTTAFKIILSDTNVRAIFVNIFGGIMRCDVIAEGIVQAVKDIGLKIPLVVRLEGNKVEEGRAILAESKLNIETIADFAKAAAQVVQLAK